ncbi:MAG: alpha/beta family hydrolase [Cyanobacteriota bacterium]|jgi:predicted alpha/beta-hydrolase family hydrolase|nr:alpha/beta fold hydrolase [Synechococcus sp. FGCU3]MEB3105497.1 alpha/beta family hydrolase [Cyanobacteriota bacterium]
MSTPPTSELLVNGAADAAATVLLAHGAGAPMDSAFMAAMGEGLAACGWRVVRFEFPYMAKQRVTGRKSAPDRMPVLQECFRAVAAKARGQGALFIGGKSMGGRIASLLADALDVAGCLCLGYPFHPPGKPQQLRTEHLAELRTPTLILQGERDTFGRREEVETYPLSPQVQVEWLTAGDHSFKPTKSSGLSEADNWQAAVAQADRFMRAVLAT